MLSKIDRKRYLLNLYKGGGGGGGLDAVRYKSYNSS